MRVFLEPMCPKSVNGISINPEPNWNNEEEEEEEEEDHSQICTAWKRFAYDDELYLSDESDDEFDHEPEYMMMNKVINDHQTKLKEDIRNQVSVLETELMNEIKTYRSAIARVEKYREDRREVERKLDHQYQRKVSEALDTHLTSVQVAEEKAVIERVNVVGISSATSNAQAGESVLILEKQRLKKLEELEATNQLLKSCLNYDFNSFEKRIGRMIRQITAVNDTVSKKSNEIVKIFRDPRCPVSISIATFAKKMVSSRNPFACSYVIVYVTTYFPQAMDILLAEFHKACSYTVPKQSVVNSQSTRDSEAHERVDSIMRLYGALVQTDIRSNVHGIEHGWAWFNKISPNNKDAATALNAFLQTAGFGLHQRYKSQFVNVLRKHLLMMKAEEEDLQLIISKITAYLDDQMYLKEPQGRTMKTSLLSTEFIAELDQHYYSELLQRLLFEK